MQIINNNNGSIIHPCMKFLRYGLQWVSTQQSNNPMANVGPKGSKSPCDTWTAFHKDKHKVVMINAYGKPLAKLAVWIYKKIKNIFSYQRKLNNQYR